MQPPPPAPPPPAPVSPPRRGGRIFLLTVILLVIAFLAGFIPQWWALRTAQAELKTVQLDLRLADLHRLLGVASEEAQRNNYASAAEAARRFFDEGAALARSGALDAEPRTQNALLGYASQRDEVMALLSAADPAARERLAGMFLAMNGVLARRAA